MTSMIVFEQSSRLVVAIRLSLCHLCEIVTASLRDKFCYHKVYNMTVKVKVIVIVTGTISGRQYMWLACCSRIGHGYFLTMV